MDEQIYSIPEGLRVYAIGDVHGYLEPLQKIHDEISKDLIANPIDQVHLVYLGDYVDRGPDSRAVIDFLIERRDRGDGIQKTLLLGNHEDAIFEFMNDPVGHDWLRYGGIQTLSSYGITFEHDVPLPSEIENVPERMKSHIPSSHFEFFRSLQLELELGDYLFVHAGVDPTKPLKRQSAQVLTRVREPFLNWHKNPAYKPLEKMIVHGHTVSKEPVVRPHRVGLDTGFYEGGALTAGVFENQQIRYLQVSA